MDAGQRNLNYIFMRSTMLDIPFFQRSYVWGEVEWEQMLADAENVSQTSKPYFMGSIILKQQLTATGASSSEVRTIIDGQQRLTTLSILLKVLSLKNPSDITLFEGHFKLYDGGNVIRHSYNDVAAYNAIMNYEALQISDGKDTISQSYQYFVKNLDENKLNFAEICKSMQFVVIDLVGDEDEQQIFDTINSLGVRLTTAELLKNYFFGRDELALYEKYWHEIFEKNEEGEYWNKEITTGRTKPAIIDLFFYSFLQIKIQDAAFNVSSDHKKDFSKVEKLFDSYKRFIKIYCNDDKHAMLKEISEYAKLFKKTFEPEMAEKVISSSFGIERLNVIVFALDTATLIPYILFVEHSVSDEAIRNELYGYLESYIMRRLVTRSTTKNYRQLFSDQLISNRILSKQELKEYINTQEDRLNRMPADSDIGTAFHKEGLTNKYAAGVLYLIESHVRSSHHSTALLGLNKYSLEHIMPKNWRKSGNWEFDGDENLRNSKLLTLGNLTIVTQSLNSSIRDANWATKLAGRNNKGGFREYAAGIEIMAEYLKSDTWDESKIEERADHLLEKALETWPIG